jgi:hypothetical protein
MHAQSAEFRVLSPRVISLIVPEGKRVCLDQYGRQQKQQQGQHAGTRGLVRPGTNLDNQQRKKGPNSPESRSQIKRGSV